MYRNLWDLKHLLPHVLKLYQVSYVQKQSTIHSLPVDVLAVTSVKPYDFLSTCRPRLKCNYEAKVD